MVVESAAASLVLPSQSCLLPDLVRVLGASHDRLDYLEDSAITQYIINLLRGMYIFV